MKVIRELFKYWKRESTNCNVYYIEVFYRRDHYIEYKIVKNL